MFKYSEYYYELENKDACDICEDQINFLVALSLTNACTQIGK